MPKFIYYIYLLPLLLSAVFSLRAFRLNWPSLYKHFSIFLFSTLFIEGFAICWKLFLHSSVGNYSMSNLWIYNCYLIAQYLFYLYFYYLATRNSNVKRWIVALAGIYFLFSLINVIFIQPIHTVNSYTIIAASLIMLFLTLTYFIELLRDKEIKNLTSEPLVWISIGAFIFHIGNLPFFIFLNTLNKTNLSLALTLFKIILILNSLMYSFYAIAFLCQPKFPKPH
jgi:hypothetical protein